MTLSAEDILQMDYDDPLKEYKDKFQLPNGIIYMDGNSLGAMPKITQDVINNTVRNEWGDGLITSWLGADWVNSPQRV